MNTPLTVEDDEYPIDLTDNYICQTCEDTGGFWQHSNFKPCPVCHGKKKEDHDE